MNILACGQPPGHEIDFDKRTNAVFRPGHHRFDLRMKNCISGLTVVLVVNPDFIVENRMEADILKLGDLLHFAALR
jgi:hypothetical protein